MATTITPGIGAGVLFTQQGVGTSPGYAGIDLRRSDSLALQEGVYGASDFMVVQHAAGANMSVDIGMPAGGFALVQGDSVAGQGLYTIPVHASTVTETIAAADATNPRVDSAILEVLDNVHDASGSSLARVRVLTGTAQAGATLASRAGAPTLPSSALLLADLLVTAAATSVDNTKIRDRRKFARGAMVRLARTSTNPTTASGTHVAIDTVTLQARIECSGVPLRVTLNVFASNGTAGLGVGVGFQVDGSQVDGTNDLMEMTSSGAGQAEPCGFSYVTTPSAGSHLLTATFRAAGGGGTASLFATTSFPCVFIVEEVVRQNTANNSVTSG